MTPVTVWEPRNGAAEAARDAGALPSSQPDARLHFDLNSDAVRFEDRAALQKIAQIANEQHTATIALVGYSDEPGSRELNVALGQRRAEQVEAALAELGVAAKRIRVVSYGEERSGRSPAERRRVDVYVRRRTQ